jgi:hypothetical protein
MHSCEPGVMLRSIYHQVSKLYAVHTNSVLPLQLGIAAYLEVENKVLVEQIQVNYPDTMVARSPYAPTMLVVPDRYR